MLLNMYISLIEKDILAGGGHKAIVYPCNKSDSVVIERVSKKYEIIFYSRKSKFNEYLEREIKNYMYNELTFDNIIVDRPRKISVLIADENYNYEQFFINIRYNNCVFTEKLSASDLLGSEFINDCCVGNSYDI